MGIVDTIFSFVPKLRRADQSLADASADGDGNLLVNVTKTATPTTIWSDPLAGTPLTYERLVASTPRKLHTWWACNEGTTDKWIMLFDRAALFTGDGAEPLFAFKVPGNGGVVSQDLRRPRVFTGGIIWHVSSTANVLTRDTSALFRATFEVE